MDQENDFLNAMPNEEEIYAAFKTNLKAQSTGVKWNDCSLL